MVAILKHVGTVDWERERLNMSVNTCSDDAARDASLARVNTIKCLTHIGHGGGEPTVLVSGPRWHCIILKAGKEGI
jgi:hypothetical protein